ncbi:MAG: hypothetical protein AABY01_01300 [Nanoarchaeota archaeon]
MTRGEMSIGIVVALALGLIILLILLGVVVSRVGIFGKSSENVAADANAGLCFGKGQCIAKELPCTTPVSGMPISGWTDCSGTCCKP